MTKRLMALGLGMLLASIFALGGCNTQYDCPAKETISPDGPCGSEALQCGYDLVTPNLTCDGTTVTLASSCTCTSGAWACPSPATCGGGDADGGATDDAATDDAATDDATTPTGDAATDARASDAAATD